MCRALVDVIYPTKKEWIRQDRIHSFYFAGSGLT